MEPTEKQEKAIKAADDHASRMLKQYTKELSELINLCHDGNLPIGAITVLATHLSKRLSQLSLGVAALSSGNPLEWIMDHFPEWSREVREDTIAHLNRTEAAAANLKGTREEVEELKAALKKKFR